jgi:integrase
MIETYAQKPGLSAEQVTRCRHFWDEFAKLVKVTTLRELTHELVGNYEAKVLAKDLAAKSVHHRFSAIKTVIAFGLKRGKHADDCRKALDLLGMLEVDGVNTLDPRPISKVDFNKIRKAATAAGDMTFAALMLFALNACLYPSEVGAVKWDDVDIDRAEFSTKRRKTGVPRVCCLWPETVKGIKALPRDKTTIFNTTRQPYTRFSINDVWIKYRKAAEVSDDVRFAEIRDAAFTCACRIGSDPARVLAGHRLPGATDHYVRRDPQFVADACAAIRKEYGPF